MNMLSRLLDRPRSGGVVIEPMRHRHVNHALAIERTAYPKPWSARVFHDELDQVRDGTRLLPDRQARPTPSSATPG